MGYNKSALDDARNFATKVSSASSSDNAIGLLANAVLRICEAIENKPTIPNDDSGFDQKAAVKGVKKAAAKATEVARKNKPKK